MIINWSDPQQTYYPSLGIVSWSTTYVDVSVVSIYYTLIGTQEDYYTIYGVKSTYITIQGSEPGYLTLYGE